jgi:hypothetical protein
VLIKIILDIVITKNKVNMLHTTASGDNSLLEHVVELYTVYMQLHCK